MSGRSQGKRRMGRLYERVVRMSQIIWAPENKGRPWPDLLRGAFDDVGINITMLLAILKFFPNKEQWENSTLYDLCRQVGDTLRAREKERRKGGQ